MKRLFNLILVTIVVISFSSCENNDSDLTATTAPTMHLMTENGNNFNSWKWYRTDNLPFYMKLEAYTYNDYTNWVINEEKWGHYGNIKQVNPGDGTHWSGTFTDKGNSNGLLKLDVVNENDYNEWIYSSEYPNIKKYMWIIRTTVKDDFNSFSFYAPNNQYLFKVKTVRTDDFTDWNFIDWEGNEAKDYGGLVGLVPVLIITAQQL